MPRVKLTKSVIDALPTPAKVWENRLTSAEASYQPYPKLYCTIVRYGSIPNSAQSVKETEVAKEARRGLSFEQKTSRSDLSAREVGSAGEFS